MKQQLRKFINFVRLHTPDKIRWYVGPYISYLAYLFRIYILGNKDAPKVLSLRETIKFISQNNLSIIRFGDGEMSAINHSDLGFQKANQTLSLRLKEIIQVNQKGLLICVPGMFSKLDDFAGIPFWFALHHQFRYRHQWLELLSSQQIYGDTLITRPYLAYKQSLRETSGEIFQALFKLWESKNVVLVEGAKSRMGVGNDMFEKTSSLKRILCPAENAFEKYEQILQTVKAHTNKNDLILVSLGPTAKVLAYDLFLLGYRVLDIGHLDMEYEMFLRKELVETKVRYKYFNEIHERNPEDCLDPVYLKQIIANIQ